MRALLLLFIVGCAPLTELEVEERAWRAGINLQNWELCELAYRQSGKPTWHVGHSHKHPGSMAQRAWNVRDDLRVNFCKSILGKYWAEY